MSRRGRGTYVLISSSVAHDTDSLDGSEDHEGLADLGVLTRLEEFLNENVVSLTEDITLLLGDLTEDTNGETGTREGMAPDEVGGETELKTKSTDLSNELLPQDILHP